VEFSHDFFYDEWDMVYVGNNTFKMYLTFITYREDPSIGGYVFYPMERERAEEYLRYARIYSMVFEELLGVNLVFEYIEPEKVCKGLPATTYREFEEPNIECETWYNEIPVVTVIEAPGIPEGTPGAYYYGSQTIYLDQKDQYGTFIHELGHALGLKDIYLLEHECREGEKYKCREWMGKKVCTPCLGEVGSALFYCSIMDDEHPCAAISLGDFASLTILAYWTSYDPTTGKYSEYIKERARSLGIDVENSLIFLPLTPNGEIPPGIDEVIKRGVLIIDWKNPEASKLNYDLITLLKNR